MKWLYKDSKFLGTNNIYIKKARANHPCGQPYDSDFHILSAALGNLVSNHSVEVVGLKQLLERDVHAVAPVVA